MNIFESIMLAFDSIRVNKLRAILTLLSISIGVFAIMGAGTLVRSIDSTISGEMEELGENTFSIYKMPKLQLGHEAWHKYQKRKPITFSQARDFKRKMDPDCQVSYYTGGVGFQAKYGNNETDPDVMLLGCDENFLYTNYYKMSDGRPFMENDVNFCKNVCIIGNDVIVKAFPNINPIGKILKVKNQKYEVIGTLEVKGAMLGRSQDNVILIPATQYLKYFSSEQDETLTLNIKAPSKEELTSSLDEATGIMRTIRNCKPWEENSFEIETNEAIAEQFSNLTDYLTYFGFFSGAIALIAAGVGIMNIMLVSVKERTREIGIRKAIGAKRSWILTQFIVEAITLCQVGGMIGVLMGFAASSLFGKLISIKMSVPFDWVIVSLAICTFLGLVFGAYPAWKAAKLDPIEALRYE